MCFLSDAELLHGIHSCKAGDEKQELSLMEDPVLLYKLFTVIGAWNKSWKGGCSAEIVPVCELAEDEQNKTIS